MRLLLIPSVLFMALVLPGVVVQPATAQDDNGCRRLCDNDKHQCRIGHGALDAASTVGAVGLLSLMIGQPKTFAGTEGVDAKRDMRDVLSDRQRATAAAKSAKQEQVDRCKHIYMQCLQACAAPPDEVQETTPQK